MEEDQSTDVLIVDDEEALLESYAAMLSSRYEVQTATTGERALAAADSRTDVVLLDRRMPDRSGREILSEIRSRELDCQVVFCSAVVPGVDIVSLDIDAYLHKPVGPETLFETIDTQAELATHDEGVREYAALEAKRAAIERAGTGTMLMTDEQYRDLLERIEQKEQSVDADGIDAVPARAASR